MSTSTTHAQSDDARFPIGKFQYTPATTVEQRSAHIDTIAALPAKLRAAVANADAQQLDTPYREGGWTVRQVVHHLPDSHMNSYVRFKLALTEDSPAVTPYDEAAWAELPDSRDDIAASLDLLTALHTRWTSLLRTMSEADWQRTFTHPALGTGTLDRALALYAWHGEHHLAHVRQALRVEFRR